MNTHRFYISPERWSLKPLALDESEAHHCIDVLRLGLRSRVVVFDGRGSEITAEITAVSAVVAAITPTTAAISTIIAAITSTTGSTTPWGRSSLSRFDVVDWCRKGQSIET